MEPNYGKPYNHGQIQNVTNIWKDTQAKPAELNMTKLVNNGEILTLDTESMSN